MGQFCGGITLTRALRKKLKRRNAVEPTIGHLKHDHRMGRCYLKGAHGDQINALGAAMGLNLRKLLAGIGRRSRCAVQAVLLWLEKPIEDHIRPLEYQSARG